MGYGYAAIGHKRRISTDTMQRVSPVQRRKGDEKEERRKRGRRKTIPSAESQQHEQGSLCQRAAAAAPSTIVQKGEALDRTSGS